MTKSLPAVVETTNVHTSVEPSAPHCYGFQWLGWLNLPFPSCHNCRAPYWVHTHEEVDAKRDGSRVSPGRIYRRVISANDKEAAKSGWG